MARVRRIDVDGADRAAGVVRCGTGSIRVQTTAAAASFAFSVMNTRPGLVAAHIVLVSCEVRAIQATAPPRRVLPYTGTNGGLGGDGSA